MELVVHNSLVTELDLALETPLLDPVPYEAKMTGCVDELRKARDSRWEVLSSELELIRTSGSAAVADLLSRPQLSGQRVTEVVHTAGDFAGGRAGDLGLVLADGQTVAVSCKTDKSGKVALADLGQTSIERAAEGFYGIEPLALEELCEEKLGRSLVEAKESYYTASQLWREVMIQQLEISDADINDFSAARATSVGGVRRLLECVKGSIHGNDDAVLLVVSRKDGGISSGTSLDELDPSVTKPSDIAFTPGRPKAGKPVGTTIGIKWRAPGAEEFATIFDHQVKHQRGKNSSEAFRDITTRVMA